MRAGNEPAMAGVARDPGRIGGGNLGRELRLALILRLQGLAPPLAGPRSFRDIAAGRKDRNAGGSRHGLGAGRRLRG